MEASGSAGGASLHWVGLVQIRRCFKSLQDNRFLYLKYFIIHEDMIVG
jgi:hypothetical protein